jgi:hypothetical protein
MIREMLQPGEEQRRDFWGIPIRKQIACASRPVPYSIELQMEPSS